MGERDFSSVSVRAIAACGVEVFSLLRESDLGPEEYIDAFFNSGGALERTV
jgi:hypothetical protein